MGSGRIKPIGIVFDESVRKSCRLAFDECILRMVFFLRENIMKNICAIFLPWLLVACATQTPVKIPVKSQYQIDLDYHIVMAKLGVTSHQKACARIRDSYSKNVGALKPVDQQFFSFWESVAGAIDKGKVSAENGYADIFAKGREITNPKVEAVQVRAQQVASNGGEGLGAFLNALAIVLSAYGQAQQSAMPTYIYSNPAPPMPASPRVVNCVSRTVGIQTTTSCY